MVSNDFLIRERLLEMDNLLLFYYGIGKENEQSERIWTESTAWIDGEAFVRFILDAQGSRVEIGLRRQKRLMFLGQVKGGVVVYGEAVPEVKPDWSLRYQIKDALLDLYGCVGYITGKCDATRTGTERAPRARREA